MAKNDDVQDERYVVLPWMAKNDDVQDERSWPFLGIHAFSALVLPARYFSSRKSISTYVLPDNGAITRM
jgi:hypothetical protein